MIHWSFNIYYSCCLCLNLEYQFCANLELYNFAILIVNGIMVPPWKVWNVSVSVTDAERNLSKYRAYFYWNYADTTMRLTEVLITKQPSLQLTVSLNWSCSTCNWCQIGWGSQEPAESLGEALTVPHSVEVLLFPLQWINCCCCTHLEILVFTCSSCRYGGIRAKVDCDPALGWAGQ